MSKMAPAKMHRNLVDMADTLKTSEKYESLTCPRHEGV